MNGPQIKISIDYYLTDSDNSKCNLCEMQIIGKMYQQIIFIDLEPAEQPIKFCEACYNEKDET